MSTISFINLLAKGKKILSRKFSYGNIYKIQSPKLEYLDPQPSDERLNEIYSSSYYDTWGFNTSHEYLKKQKKQTFQLRVDILKKLLPINSKILDLGCATGFFMEVAQENGFEPSGLDLSSFAIEECRKTFAKEQTFCGQLQDAINSDFFKHKFNSICMFDYIEHLRDPMAVIKSLDKLLLDDGYIMITTPKLNSLSNLLMGSSWSHYKEEHLYYFSTESLTQLLKELGYKEIMEFPAYKYITPDYLNGYFNTYQNKFITKIINFIYKFLPEKIKFKAFKFSLGDLLIVARK